MSSETYLFEESFSNALGIECDFCLSDQEIDRLLKESPKVPWSKLISEQMKRGQAKEMARIFYDQYNGREFQSNHFKKLWADPEHKKRHIESMIKERNSPEGKKRMQESAQKKWDSRSEEYRKNFRSKMTDINTDESKRKDAGEKIKKKWEDPDFKEKMSKRKTRGSDGSAMKKLWDDPVWRAKTLESRRKKREERIK